MAINDNKRRELREKRRAKRAAKKAERQAAIKASRQGNQKTAEDFRRQERESEFKANDFSSMEQMDAVNKLKELSSKRLYDQYGIRPRDKNDPDYDKYLNDITSGNMGSWMVKNPSSSKIIGWQILDEINETGKSRSLGDVYNEIGDQFTDKEKKLINDYFIDSGAKSFESLASPKGEEDLRYFREDEESIGRIMKGRREKLEKVKKLRDDYVSGKLKDIEGEPYESAYKKKGSYKSEKTGSQMSWGTGEETPTYKTSSKGFTVISPEKYTEEDMARLKSEYDSRKKDSSPKKGKEFEGFERLPQEASEYGTFNFERLPQEASEYGTFKLEPIKTSEQEAKQNINNAINNAEKDSDVEDQIINNASSNPDITFGQFNDVANNAKKAQNIVNQDTKEQIIDAVNQSDEPIGGDGRTIGQVLSAQQQPSAGYVPSMAQDPNAKKNIGNEIVKGSTNKALMNMYSAPSRIGAIERLGVTDYYPEAGRNIAVGTFNGEVIGSQTIYSGAGALAPLGLYDARRRALKLDAMNKVKKLDEIMKLPNAPAQFQVKYGENAYNKISDLLAQYGYNPDAIKGNPAAFRELQRLRDIATEMHYYDKYADKIIAASQEGKTWVDKDMLEDARKIKNAQVNEVDQIVNGDKSLREYFENAGVYLNPMKWADETSKEIYANERLSEMPLMLKEPSKSQDADKYYQDMNEFMEVVKRGDWTSDIYVTGVKRFFDIENLKKIVDDAFEVNNFPAKAKQRTLDYLIAKMPQKEILKYQSVGNLNAQRMAESGRNWRAKQRLEKEYPKTLWENVAIEEKDLRGELASVTGTAQEKLEKQKQIMAKYGYEVSPDGKSYSNTVVVQDPRDPQLSSNNPMNQKVRILDESGQLKNYTIREISKELAKGKKIFNADGDKKGQELSPDQKRAISMVMNPKNNIQVHSRVEMAKVNKSFIDANGNRKYLIHHDVYDGTPGSSNIDEYNASDKKSDIATPLSANFLVYNDANGKKVQVAVGLYTTGESYDLEKPSSIQILNEVSESEAQKLRRQNNRDIYESESESYSE